MQIFINRLVIILFLVSWICFIWAIIKPNYFIRWGDLEKRNKKSVLKYYGVPILIISVFCWNMFGDVPMDYTSSKPYISTEYDTGITYDQIARTPDNYKNKKVKFTGEVLQVIEKDGRTQLRIAVNNNYNNVILAEYRDDIIKTRFLENDNITLSGRFISIYTYTSTQNTSISVPGIWADNISLNK